MPINVYRNRRSPRLKDYDYAQSGAYFMTVCTHERAHLFGAVVNETMILNVCGEIVLECWDAVPRHFPNVESDLFVVMPNHVHGILIIVEIEKSVGTRHALSLPGQLQNENQSRTFARHTPGSLSVIVRSFKSAVTKRINELRGTPGAPVWHTRFHDHIIRSEEDLNQHRHYILTNPARWDIDRDNIPSDEKP